jgi:hypothetical protein
MKSRIAIAISMGIIISNYGDSLGLHWTAPLE